MNTFFENLPIEQAKISQYFSSQPVLKAWLFGSQADGTATEDSDIDILVELDYSQPIGLHFIQMIWDLEAITHKKVDLVSNAGLSPYMKPYIDKQKKLLYERR